MKKALQEIFLFLVGLGLILNFVNFVPAQAAGENLIANAGVETADVTGKAPVGWTTGQWGTNTANFAYPATGAQSGVRSLKVTISSYTDGDAKWYFTPLGVQPGTEYFYSDWYKSSVSSEVVVRFTDMANNEKFMWLGTAPVSTTWKQVSYQFKVPADVATMTVYHFINSVGYLQTDSFLLRTPESLSIDNGVPNSSLEQTNNGTEPIGWRKENWGTNTAKFSYLPTGHTGTRSVKVQVTKYTDGDAKWGYLPQSATPGADYLFTDYYQSNVTTQVVVRVTKTDGTDKYLGLSSAAASTAWKKYSDIFTVPIDAKEITVLHIIARVGYLVTDDYAVQPHQINGFNRGLVSLTFDDGWEENYTSVLPILTQYGFKSTQYYATTYIQGSGEEYKVKAFAAAGHEIGSHSITHPFLTKVTLTKLVRELTNSKKYLETLVGVGKVVEFATPYGDYDSRVISEIQKVYRSHRSTDEGYNSKDNFNIYNIRVQNMTNTTSLAQYEEWLRKAEADKTWLVIIYHRVGENPDQFETSPTDFAAQMQFLSQSGLTVETIGQALDEVLPQLQ